MDFLQTVSLFAEAAPTGGLSTAGLVVMCVSIGAVLCLVSFCLYKSLFAATGRGRRACQRPARNRYGRCFRRRLSLAVAGKRFIDDAKKFFRCFDHRHPRAERARPPSTLCIATRVFSHQNAAFFCAEAATDQLEVV